MGAIVWLSMEEDFHPKVYHSDCISVFGGVTDGTRAKGNPSSLIRIPCARFLILTASCGYHSKNQAPDDGLKKVSVKRLVEKRVAKAIEEYEKSRVNLDSAWKFRRRTMEMLDNL
ncbi:hypothetical protein Tco_0746348 [Tanacetum coccineum]